MLATLAVLRGPVDNFFDNVMVNAEDPALRATRQALLKRLYDVMNKVAEIGPSRQISERAFKRLFLEPFNRDPRRYDFVLDPFFYPA